MKLRDGLPVEWRVTLFYLVAATFLTLVIVASDRDQQGKVAESIDHMHRDVMMLHEESPCDPHPKGESE